MKDKYGCLLANHEIIVLNAAKYLQKKDYINIFKINKNINKKLRNILLKYQLTQLNITIDERIKIWEIFLNINEVKTKYNYSILKKVAQNIKEEDDAKLAKATLIIDLDLSRTPLFRKDNNHKQKAFNILKCLNTINDMPENHQGMNFVLLLLYLDEKFLN